MRLKLTRFHWIVLIYALVSVVFVFRLGLTEQESYYWLWAKNPDWSYFDHPPLQAWVTALLTFLFGDEKWVVRLPAFFGDLSVLILFHQWAKHKWGEKTAEVCSLLLISSTVFMMGSVIALPDSLAVPLALAAMLCAQKGYIKRAGFFLGLALLGKWTVVFIVPGIVYALYRQNKFRWPDILSFGAIVLTLQIPVIAWNLNHGNVSAKFHLYGRHAHEWLTASLYAENVFHFFLAQIFSLGITTSGLIFYFIWKRRPFLLLTAEHWKAVFFWTMPGLAIVLISAAQGQLRFYWTFLSLIPVISLTGYITTQIFPNAVKKIHIFVIAALIFQWSCGLVAGFYPIGHTIEATLNLKSDLRRTPMGEFTGWYQWYKTTIIPTGLLDDKTALLGSDLHVASRLSWTVRRTRDIASVGVAGDSKNQFQFWDQPLPPRYTKAIFFADNRYDRLANFENICAHPVNWKTSTSTVLNRNVKEVYWAYCDELLSPVTTSSTIGRF